MVRKPQPQVALQLLSFAFGAIVGASLALTSALLWYLNSDRYENPHSPQLRVAKASAVLGGPPSIAPSSAPKALTGRQAVSVSPSVGPVLPVHLDEQKREDDISWMTRPLDGRPEDYLLQPWRPMLLPPPLQKFELKTVSVVMVARNEHKFVQRSVDSIVETTSSDALVEIIVVDDASDPPMSTAITHWPPRDLLKIVRLEENQGLMRARVSGAEAATGDMLVFLDCHIKAQKNWFPPISRHLNENYRRVVTPSIPVIDSDWKLHEGTNTVGQVFDWSLNTMMWIDSPNDWVMVPAGGLFGVSRKWWFESGEYDTGMLGWGMEQLEQAVRVWLCGGEIVVDRASVIGHYYRKNGEKPYKDPGGSLRRNQVRAVEVWFSSYKDYFYRSHPDARDVQRRGDAGDISERLKLKQHLGCKPFDSFVENFRPYMIIFGLVPDSRARQERDYLSCRWITREKSFLGELSGVWPDIPTRAFSVTEAGGEALALRRAKLHCESLGAVCSGVTCDSKDCSARRGTPYLKKSPSGETSHIKICCRHERIENVYLRRVAFVYPPLPLNEIQFPPQDADLANQRCEALTDLCVGVTCDGKICSPREGNGGLQTSPSGEVTYIKICS
eukprot:TRINITY_DN7431_c1_g2_i1.p1 TRINITY_DN7431_c1_g2~~TRINITY_DN7431_c1_g2_i1.p1  ORF type:complete len:647 (-),score=70.94 TRINITY_DN7431_c1_g2_i1:272-2113(-)